MSRLIKGNEQPKQSLNQSDDIKSINTTKSVVIDGGKRFLKSIVETHCTSYIPTPKHVTAQAWFTFVGTSMEPTIKEGDIIGVVAAENWDHIDPNKVYMIVSWNYKDLMVKRLRVDKSDPEILWCVSDNYKEYKEFKIHVSEIKSLLRVDWMMKDAQDWHML